MTNMSDPERDRIYRLLEEKMMRYEEYSGIPVIPEENEVQFVAPASSTVLFYRPIRTGLATLPTEGILLRAPVADRLYWAGQEIKGFDKDLRLEVVCGYWSPEEHERLYAKTRQSLSLVYEDESELRAAVHRQIAIPDVAGHPTGGAIDVQILKGDEPVDMGSSMWDFGKDAFTFSPFVSVEGWENRQLLRRAMLSAGFAPYDGEWWHFSYGTKEWARYYDKPGALYDQVPAGSVQLRGDSGSLI